MSQIVYGLFSRMKGAGLTDAEIALRVGVHQTTVSRWRRRHALPKLSPGVASAHANEKQILGMLAADFSISEIARHLGMPRGRVSYYVLSRGLREKRHAGTKAGNALEDTSADA